MMPAVPTVVLAVGLGLVIEGQTTCPSPSDVAAALRPLLQEEVSGGNNRLQLTQTAAGVILELFDGQNARLARRELPPDVSCSAQAHRVAVIAAAWQAELSDEPPAVPPVPLVVPLVDGAPRSEAAQLWPPPAPPPAEANPLYLGTGLRLVYAPNGGVAAAFEIEAGAIWDHWGFGGGVWIDATRTLNEADSEQKFVRLGGELGPVVSLGHDPEFHLRVQAIASGLLADRGYFDPGVTAGLRFVPGQPPVRLFLELAAIAWPRWFPSNTPLPMSWFEGYVAVGLVLGGT